MKAEIPTIMSKNLITVSADSPLAEATRLMKEHQIRHLPVVDDKNTLVGVLSARDLPAFSGLMDVNVKFYMNVPPIFVSYKTSLKSAIYRMLEEKISSILISDSDDNVVGIITTEDLLWYLVTQIESQDESAKPSFKKILDLQTLGQVAHQLSLAGI